MNDKINKNAETLGYCCAYGFFGCNQRKSDSNTKLAKKLDVSIRTMEYCKQKLREGHLVCQGKEGCMNDQFTKG